MTCKHLVIKKKQNKNNLHERKVMKRLLFRSTFDFQVVCVTLEVFSTLTDCLVGLV